MDSDASVSVAEDATMTVTIRRRPFCGRVMYLPGLWREYRRLGLPWRVQWICMGLVLIPWRRSWRIRLPSAGGQDARSR